MQKNSPKFRLLVTLAFSVLLFAGISAHAAKRLHIIELKHVFAQEIVPVLQPHLSAGSTASAYDNKLLLNIDEQELSALETIIARLDSAALRLIVSVRQRRDDHQQQTRSAADIQLSNQGNRAELRLHQQTARDQDASVQSVQTISGQAAFLQTGVEIPMLTAHYSAYGGVTIDQRYRATGTGFFVLPRVNGDYVQVQINPEQSQTRGDGTVAVNVLRTEVRGQLGQWIALGGSGQEQHLAQGSWQNRSVQTDNREQWRVEIKVEAID